MKRGILEMCLPQLSFLFLIHNIFFHIMKNAFYIGKTHFEVPVLILFSIFSPCTFILRHWILVLLFSYRFRPSVRAH